MLPLTVIGGYLGAGKTTLVNHLLRNADGVRLAILVNEFGALPIDEDLIEAQDDDIISIAGGCVCCSYGSDLTLALMDLAQLDPRPDHVLLEASGVALPQIADPYISDTIERQCNDADLIVLNKIDLIAQAERSLLLQRMQGRAPQAKIVTATHGTLPPDVLLQSFLGRDRDVSQPMHNSKGYETRSIEVTHPVDAEALAQGLAAENLGLLRAKGFVDHKNGERKLIQVVGRRWSVADSDVQVDSCGFVVIGQSHTFNEETIWQLISETSWFPSSPPR